jgi:cell division protein ZapA (FtsZ GTPase activity inhibitor)
MREIASTLSLRSVAKIAVLTAVNLADELMKEKRAGLELEQRAAVGADRLARTTNGLE